MYNQDAVLENCYEDVVDKVYKGSFYLKDERIDNLIDIITDLMVEISDLKIEVENLKHE